jgi:hypothetical protein
MMVHNNCSATTRSQMATVCNHQSFNTAVYHSAAARMLVCTVKLYTMCLVRVLKQVHVAYLKPPEHEWPQYFVQL